ncbi:MAG: amidohydrolase family protein [Gaiellaceae bacterium]
MPAFDVHQHLWPESLVEALRARATPPRLVGEVLELAEGSFPADLKAHELGSRLRLLDGCGLDVAVVSLQPTLGWEEAPELRDAYHEGIGELVAASAGRLRAFAAGACLNGFEGACVSAGAVVRGLGTLPAELERGEQVLFVHPGPPSPPPTGAPSWWAAVVDYTAQMQAAFWAWLAADAGRYPGLPVIFSFLAGGAPFQLERLFARGGDVRSGLDANIYLESSSYGRRALELSLDAYGAGRLLFGSDTPVLDPGPGLRALADLGEALAATMLEENPTRLFT